jgi:hypothetical protein
MDCHQDTHHGQFLARADGGECGACHRVEGWKPSTFETAAHQQIAYRLEGRHSAVSCAKCHTPAGTETRYRIRFDRCTDCHADAHRKEFSAAPYTDRCEACHTVKGFQPSTFKLAKHQDTRFSLGGAHVAIACLECHRSRDASDPPAGRFRMADLSCTGCHQDPHGGVFNKLMIASRSAPGCEACHGQKRWSDVSRFDHSTTAFALEGIHRGVACGECHRPAEAGGSVRSVRFGQAPSRCEGCHEDVHGRQFAASGLTDCAKCHGVYKWKPSRFDHDKDSDFRLTGAHREVACGLCHTTNRRVGGNVVRVFKPTARECSACHGPDLAG